MKNLFNIKTFILFLGKNRMYTLINVCGLAVSLMFVILIAVYTAQELSTDSFQQKADRLYLLANTGGEDENFESFYGTAYRLADRISERYPEIEKLCPMAPLGDVPVSIGNTFFNAKLLLADTTFFEIFTFPLIIGEPSLVLSGKYSAVISEDFAKKAFPGIDPIGQRIDMGGDFMTLTVSGVMKEIKNSIVPQSDIVARMDNVGTFNPSMDSPNFSNAGSALIYILAKEGADLQSKADDMSAFFKEIFWFYQRGIFTKVAFVPMREVYFSAIEGSDLVEKGSRTFVLILMSVGILILLFAVINYINLTSAQAGFRAKEMATRRLLGSSRWELFVRLILEAALLSLISFVIGLILAFYGQTYAGNLLEKPLNIMDFVSPLSALACVALIAVLGILAGILPALIMSSAKPVDVMKGSLRTKNKMVFSKIFITFQNVITIAMIAASITMVWQTNHLVNAPLGYNTKNIIDVRVGHESHKEQTMKTLVNELNGSPYVSLVSLCQGTPFTRGNNNTFEYQGRNISMQSLVGDSAYFKMLGIEILRDNGLEPEKGAYLTQHTFKELNIDEAAQEIHLNDKWTEAIAGVVRDFQLRDITYGQSVVRLEIRKFDFENRAPWNMLVQVQGEPASAYRSVKDIYERVVRLPFNAQFIDLQVADNFKAIKRTSMIVSIFCGIAILISLLGLLAISTYFVQQRSREIAVRKVFGANNREVLAKLVGSFMTYVGVAFLIATPIVWYVMREWLADYPYRIPLSPLIFIAAGLFCFAASFVTVLAQSYTAASANPVGRLKAE